METIDTVLDVLFGGPVGAALLACALVAVGLARRPGPLPPLGSERGSMLIEVMVGAIVLAITTTAVLNGLDAAQGTGSRNKARSVAAQLAEQDQERLRAMPVANLVGFSETRTVVVRGVNYTVVSKTSWATDTGGSVSCSNNLKTAANLRIVSEVSSQATKGVVDQASLVTPPPGSFGPGEGRIVVKVVDRNQAPIAGANVALSGTGSFSDTTNSLGCAVFPFVPEGNYTATVTSLGLVGWEGTSPVTKDTSATAGTSTATTLELDQPAEILANFDTRVGGTTVTTDVKSQWITVTNSKLTVGRKEFEANPAGAPNTLVRATSLYPFLDGYGVYAGRCTANNPALAPTGNSSLLQTYSPSPGQSLTTSPRVRMPSINIRVVTSSFDSASGINGATVFVEPADSGCTDTFPSQASENSAADDDGALRDPGFPYGTYRLCAQRTVSGVTTHGHADVRPFSTSHVDEVVSNTDPNGNATNMTTSGSSIRIRLSPSGNGPCH